MNNITEVFNEILDELKKDTRPSKEVSKELLDSIISNWQKIIDEKNWQELMPVLCILSHSKTLFSELDELIFKTLNSEASDNIKIYTLEVANLHIIKRNFRNGDRVPFKYIESVRVLLKTSKSPELIEWTLRSIEQIRNQVILLKDDILKAKPGILSLGKHKKNIRDIINLIETRWQRS